MPHEFTIGEQAYRCEKLNAFDQLTVARCILPALPKVLAAKSLSAADGDQAVLEGFQVAADALYAISEADLQKIIKLCLSASQRNLGGNWASLYLKEADRMLDERLSLANMIMITVEVIKYNLSDFFDGPFSTLVGSTRGRG